MDSGADVLRRLGKKSIADLLKLSRSHVTALIQVFEKDNFAALEDKRARPENHPDNQMTLPFMDQVFQAQLKYPDAGSFRLHGILEQQLGEETPSQSTVGRAMAHNRLWRGAPHPLDQDADRVEWDMLRDLASVGQFISAANTYRKF